MVSCCNPPLCYLERGDAYPDAPSGEKEHDANRDKWIGIGGKFEDKESPEDCLLGNAWEETGLTLTDYRYRGLVTFCEYGVAHGVYAPVYRYRLDRRTSRLR
ncbi:MAG: NUDIX domain-containing protein [Dysosmobacter sp.]